MAESASYPVGNGLPDQALSPRQSAEYISKNSKHVKISKEALHNAASLVNSELRRLHYSAKSWHENPVHPKSTDEATLNWVFVVDCLNFSFWLPSGSYSVEYNGCVYHGYMALCAAINRALDEGIPFTSPSFFKAVTLADLQHIFRPAAVDGSPIPLLEKRLEHLQEAGGVLVEKYNGRIANFVDSCEKNASKMIGKLTTEFTSFRDEGCYNGQRVAFYKRAQIMVADIWACFDGMSFGEFKDIDQLTMFADYRVPQTLQWIKVLEYSNELTSKIEAQVELENGGQMEMEIRGCSIWAVELIKDAVNEARKTSGEVDINSILVDFYLWDYATDHKEKMAPFPEHRTRCTYY